MGIYIFRGVIAEFAVDYQQTKNDSFIKFESFDVQLVSKNSRTAVYSITSRLKRVDYINETGEDCSTNSQSNTTFACFDLLPGEYTIKVTHDIVTQVIGKSYL